MQIKKFVKIDNVFSYSFFDWDQINPAHGDGSSDPIDVFKKNNIIFAENGNGKSVFVSILKSLDGQSIELKKHRDRPIVDAQEIRVFLTDDHETTFLNSRWSDKKLQNKFLIFDKNYIEEFVHSVGSTNVDTAQRKQQRGRNIVYLGNFAIYNNEIDRINTFKATVSEKNRRFIETEQLKVSGILKTHDITVEELLNEKVKIKKLNKINLTNKKEKLAKLKDELEKISKALREKSKIVALSMLIEVNAFLSLDIEQKGGVKSILNPSDLFSFTVAKGVRKTLHKMSHKRGFVQQGLSLITEGVVDCPFCEQKIKNEDYVQVVKEYQEIFDENFAIEEQKIRKFLKKYRKILENLRDLQASVDNQSTLNTAKSFVTIDCELPQFILEDEEKKIIKAEISLVFEKEKSILDKIETSRINKIKKIIKKADKFIGDYNKVVKVINVKIKKLQRDSSEGKLGAKKIDVTGKLTKTENEIFYIKNKESFQRYFKAIEQNQKNKKVVESLERIYQALKGKVVEEFDKFVSDYFDLIKRFVKEISPSMDIFEIKGRATYDRRSLRDPAQCGFRVEYNGEDCTSSLSEGEKQAIALSFFFAQLRKETDKEKIVVLDDPITSFDAGKRKSTAEVIQRETKDFGQSFVFTCDPLFREYCLKQIDNRNFYYIFKTLGASSIHYVPRKRETIYSSFESEFRDIDSEQGSSENIIINGQKLRFCLETKIKEDYFGYSEDNLVSMIKRVTGRNKEEFEKLFTHKKTILEIYSYCNTGGLAHYPRDGSTSWNELKDKIKQYLSLEL
jgi:wobble nucleotide-excising tRNase